MIKKNKHTAIKKRFDIREAIRKRLADLSFFSDKAKKALGILEAR